VKEGIMKLETWTVN